MIARLGHPHRFFSPRGSLVECSQIGQARDQHGLGHHRGQAGHAEALMDQLTFEGRHIPTEAVHRSTIVARAR